MAVAPGRLSTAGTRRRLTDAVLAAVAGAYVLLGR